MVLNVTTLAINADNMTYYCKYKTDEVYIDIGTEYPVHDDGSGTFTCSTPNHTGKRCQYMLTW